MALPIIQIADYNDIPLDFTAIAQLPNGEINYYFYGSLHREDGPAVEGCGRSGCGVSHFFLYGRSLSKKDYFKAIWPIHKDDPILGPWVAANLMELAE